MWKSKINIISTVLLLSAIVLLSYQCTENTYAQGEALYKSQCANCHMEDGSGLQGLIPPLAKADYLLENKDKLACIIRNGLHEPILVNGKSYHEQAMPANKRLKDVEITNIINYVLSAWGNNGGTVNISAVKTALEGCQVR